MGWKEKMKEGMKLIMEGCRENETSLDNCETCPFAFTGICIDVIYIAETTDAIPTTKEWKEAAK